MQINRSSHLVILLPVRDAQGVFRFASDGGPYYGINCKLDHLLPPSQQAKRRVADFLGEPDLVPYLEVLTLVDPLLEAEGEVPGLLYLMQEPTQALTVQPEWKRLIDLLRELPQGKTRVAYNKALQYYAGAATADVSILEVDGEVKARLRDLMGETDGNLLK
jgi:hypothetical protein